MVRKFIEVSRWKWIEYLVAILVGNAVYFFSLVPYLPRPLRHATFHIDLGVAVDFAVCVAVYGLIRLGSRL
jgi:hypothetical protein